MTCIENIHFWLVYNDESSQPIDYFFIIKITVYIFKIKIHSFVQ